MKALAILALCGILTMGLVAMADETAPAPDEKPAAAETKGEPHAEESPAPLPPPKDVKEAAGTVGDAVKAAKEGRWWYFSALVIMILMFVAKITKLLAVLGRWKYVVVPVLSLSAALLAAFQGGVSFDVAAGVFTTGWATGMLEELWTHGILGKAHGEET